MPLKPGAGLLFDIDGTLVESDPLHLEAFNVVFEPYGHHFDRNRFGRDLQGLANVAIGAKFLPGETPERQRAILDEKEATFRRLAAQGVEPVHGLFDLLDWADENGVPCVAVTNAPRANADMLLESIRAQHRFRAVVVAEDLAHGKPHPLPYLEGLRLIDADPEHSVAFEDSRTGIASAVAARIMTIGMATGLAPEQLIAAGAAQAARDYTDTALLDAVQTRLGA